MLPCSEVSRLYASEDLRRVSLRQRIGARLHLLMCDHCSRYVRELRLIGAAIRDEFRRLMPARPELRRLESTLRERLREEANRRREQP